MSTALITCHYCKKPGHKVKEWKKLEKDCEMEKSRNQEREKSCVVTIKQAVIRRWERRKQSKLEGRKNAVACTIARVIQIDNVFSRELAVNVRTVLLLMVEIAKNMKHIL